MAGHTGIHGISCMRNLPQASLVQFGNSSTLHLRGPCSHIAPPASFRHLTHFEPGLTKCLTDSQPHVPHALHQAQRVNPILFQKNTVTNLGSFCRYWKALYFGHLGLVFIWSCFVSCLLFLLFYTILRNLCCDTHRRNPNLDQALLCMSALISISFHLLLLSLVPYMDWVMAFSFLGMTHSGSFLLISLLDISLSGLSLVTGWGVAR